MWPGRDCHPPARLWYRASASLKAQQKSSREIPPSPQSTGYKDRNDLIQNWRLDSTNAVRLTLMCTNDVGERFIDTARINGKRRRIGGCAPRRTGSFSPEVRFAAAAGGEVTRHKQTDTLGPFENADGSRCDDEHQTTSTLISAQPLVGSLSAPGSSSVGVLISAEPTAPSATINQKAASQPQLEPGSFPPPPPRLVANAFEKHYSYTIRLEPCPNRRLDVELEHTRALDVATGPGHVANRASERRIGRWRQRCRGG
jgi:hypothetical protein